MGATKNGGDVGVSHTADGWLQLDFEGGGSVSSSATPTWPTSRP
jgi:hypothetical protein